MQFGLMFFSSVAAEHEHNRYGLLLDAARFADEHGFCCVWTPERHFHPFGGLFPNPALTSAALATITRRVQLRAGSLVSPLHDAVRIAEEWSLVDNLSGGRVAVAFASGWNINDFVLFPERYSERKQVMYEQIETVRALWRRQTVVRRNSRGKDVEVRIYPAPVQRELPLWITASGSPDTFAAAGARGANVLTHLLGQDLTELAAKIALYRRARTEHGLAAAGGRVALMLHTYLAADVASARDRARAPLTEYLRSALQLERQAAEGGGAISGGHQVDAARLPADTEADLLAAAFERYCDGASLIGTPESCEPLLARLHQIGVDEAACLIDFGVAPDEVMVGLRRLAELNERFGGEPARQQVEASVAAFLEGPEAD
jgi:natural product biosynthesis luciferase-like monooxygenase protein